jgi:hypothetical protein
MKKEALQITELLAQNLHQQCHVQVGGRLEFIWRIFLLFPGTIQPRVVDKFGGYRYRAINRVSPLLQVHWHKISFQKSDATTLDSI